MSRKAAFILGAIILTVIIFFVLNNAVLSWN